MKSHPQLLRLFRKFNQKYFDDKLPEPLIYYMHIPGDKCCGQCVFDEEADVFVITVDPQHASSRAMRHITVLHEMAHIKFWPDIRHGKKFHAEMLRLATAGGFKEIW